MESKGELGCGGKGTSEGAKYEVPEWKPISKVENARGSPGEMEQAVPFCLAEFGINTYEESVTNHECGVLDMQNCAR